MTKPLISVIIPVYNVKRYLKRCLDSVIQQTYQNLEIILIDDGSTDGSGKICQEYRQQDPRIVLIHQTNSGLSAARNRGLDICKGEYLTFIDSDDFVKPDLVEYLYGLTKKHRTKLAICAHYEQYQKNLKNLGASYAESCLSTVDCLEYMLLEKGFTMSACAKLYATKLFKDIRFPVGKLYEDVGTTYKLIMQCPKIAYGPQPKYHYVQRKKSITKSDFTIQNLDLIALTDQMCNDINQAYPELKDVTNERRMHARFSILRQTIHRPLSANLQLEEDLIVRYLKKHRDYIFKNPKATLRDKLALSALLVGKNCFKLAWAAYTKIRH